MFKLKKYGHWYFLAASALAVFAVWSAVFYIEAHRGRVFIYILDVGQGDAILIEAPNGNQVLIDGGPDSTVIARLGEVMPFWDRSLDLVVLTHPHADHLDGLVEVLKRYDVGAVLESGVNHSIPEYAEWHKIIAGRNIKTVLAAKGERVRLGHSAYLDVLAPLEDFIGVSPKNIHEAAIVMKLYYASSTALLTGDAERSLERQLVLSGANLKSDLLKVGHHGSKTSSYEDFLKSVVPQFAVISVGRKNRYGHPTQEVLDRLARFGIKTYRTDQDGDIIFESDGRSFKRVSAVAR